MKQNNIFILLISIVLLYNSCKTLSRSKKTRTKHCVFNYNVTRADSIYQYLPQVSQEIIVSDSIMVWNSYLIKLESYYANKLSLIRCDSFYYKDKKIYNKIYNHAFLYFDSTTHGIGSPVHYYTIQDPKIDSSFLLNRKEIVLIDSIEFKGVKAFKGELTYSYVFISKQKFFSSTSIEIENMDFKFSDTYTVYFNPILGIIGMVGVGYENSSFYLDSLRTICEP